MLVRHLILVQQANNDDIRKAANPIWIIKRWSVDRFGWLDSSQVVRRPSSLDGELQVEGVTEDDGDSDRSFSEKLPGATVVAKGGILSSSRGGADIFEAAKHDGTRKTKCKSIEIENLPPTLYTSGVSRSGR
jgi:hypothetical protein